MFAAPVAMHNVSVTSNRVENGDAAGLLFILDSAVDNAESNAEPGLFSTLRSSFSS